jgi:diguanylate cyclase (GGDEF)-like protein
VQERTGELALVNQNLFWHAYYDTLTSLPNRALLMNRLNEVVEQSKNQPDYRYAVMFLDVDNFKLVNDSLGHPVGDLLLVSIANRLKSCVRSKDMVARLGGDEFVVLLDGVNTIEEAIHIAERHMAIVKQPMEIQTHRLVATISMGIVFNDFNEGAEGNLRDADIAMYRAKMNGRDRFEVFESHFRTETIERMNLENDLRRAIEQGEFRLHYQPIYSLMGKQVVGFEALLRWQHPERGILQPMEFIGVAEDAGLSLSLGNWVLREACTQLSKWQSKFPQIPSLTVSVNISGQQLAQPDFSSQVLHILDETGLKPESLALEITERALMQNVELVNQDLHVLREAGVQIQIDDFGIGYSSIVRLLQLPITAIKIDRYFIQRINQDGSKIVRAIQTMSKELGLVTIAEGVESETQVHCLASLGIDLVQGFLFGKPLSSSKVERLLAQAFQSSHLADYRIAHGRIGQSVTGFGHGVVLCAPSPKVAARVSSI